VLTRIDTNIKGLFKVLIDPSRGALPVEGVKTVPDCLRVIQSCKLLLNGSIDTKDEVTYSHITMLDIVIMENVDRVRYDDSPGSMRPKSKGYKVCLHGGSPKAVVGAIKYGDKGVNFFGRHLERAL